MISLKHIKNGCLVLRKQSNSNFHLKICPVSLTSAHAATCIQGWLKRDMSLV